MLLHRPPSICRSRRAAADCSRKRLPIRRHNLQWKQPAHKWLGVGPKHFMNSAQSCSREKYTAAIRLMSKHLRAAQRERSADRLNATKFWVLIPSLLLEPREVIGIQLNRRLAATSSTMVAIPLFNDR